MRILMEHLEAGDRLDNFLTDSSVVSRCLTVALLQRATRILCRVAMMPLFYDPVPGRPRDFRRARGKKHTVACVLTVHVLAELPDMKGYVAAAQFVRSLSRDEL